MDDSMATEVIGLISMLGTLEDSDAWSAMGRAPAAMADQICVPHTSCLTSCCARGNVLLCVGQ